MLYYNTIQYVGIRVSKNLAIKIRRNQILEYKIAGFTNQKIAEKLNVSPSVVSSDIKLALESLEDSTSKNVEKMRVLTNARLENLLVPYYMKAVALNDAGEFAGDIESAEFSRKILNDIRQLWGADLKKQDINIDARNQTVVWDKDETPNQILEDKLRKLIARNNRTTAETSTESN